MDPKQFTDRQFDLAEAFGLYVFDHPEVDEILPEESLIFFEIEGDPEFNRYSREVAKRRQGMEGVPLVRVRVKGLPPPQGSPLIDPVIEPLSPRDLTVP